MEYHQGRLVDHVHLIVRDLEASKRFYRAVLDVLGIPVGDDSAEFFWAD
jgi:catechol 2,3-dioxygenase-like lactoylglutathione lyase family enzyme